MSTLREFAVNKFGDVVLDCHRFEERFDEVLNEGQSVIEVAGIEFEPARVLKELDRIAYDEHYWAWLETEQEEKNIFVIEYDVYLDKDEYLELMNEWDSKDEDSKE